MTNTHDRSLFGSLAAAGLLFAFLASGCAYDPASSTSPTTSVADVPLSPDVAILRFDDLDQAALAAVGADDPCACTTDECVSAWIEDELGCDVCVDLQCASQPIYGCSVCPEEQDDLPIPDPKDLPY